MNFVVLAVSLLSFSNPVSIGEFLRIRAAVVWEQASPFEMEQPEMKQHGASRRKSRPSAGSTVRSPSISTVSCHPEHRAIRHRASGGATALPSRHGVLEDRDRAIGVSIRQFH